MTSGVAANIRPHTTAAGLNHLGIKSSFAVGQSVITGSNVQSASVTNTTSKQTSSATQNPMTAASTSAWSSAAVPRTPAMITGTVTGYNSTGSRTSRLRARTSIAAKSVPTAAKPSVPLNTMDASHTGCA